MPPGAAIVVINAHREASNTTVSVSTNPVFDVAVLATFIGVMLLLAYIGYWAIKTK